MAILADSFYYQELRIDTINTRVFADLVAKEGDANGRGLLVTLTENGLMKDTTGITLILKWEHTSVGNQGLDNFEAVDPSKGLYKITYPTEMLNRGKVRAFIRIIDSGKLAGTRNIEITVDRGVGDDTAIASSDSFSALASALIEVQSWNDRIDDVEQDFIDRANNLDATYPTRLVSVEQQLADKVGGGKLATLADLSQDVKTAMTGGSVAVVGDNTVIESNIVDKQVTARKVSFLDRNSNNLLYLNNGTFVVNGITATVTDGQITLNGTASATAFITLRTDVSLSNALYWLKLFNPTINADVSIRITDSLDAIFLNVGATVVNANTKATLATPMVSNGKIVVKVTGGITLSNFVLKPMVKLDTNPTVYENYHVYSPNEKVRVTSVDDNTLTESKYVDDSISRKKIKVRARSSYPFDKSALLPTYSTIDFSALIDAVQDVRLFGADLNDKYWLYGYLNNFSGRYAIQIYSVATNQCVCSFDTTDATKITNGRALYKMSETYSSGITGTVVCDFTKLVSSYYFAVTADTLLDSKCIVTAKPKELYKYLLGDIACIGDSLTQGYISSAYGHTKFSYPYFLGKIINGTVANYGASGFTAINMWDGGISQNLYTLANKRSIILWLGTNAGFTDTLVADTTITEGQTYLNYAATNTGSYCKIIERIKEVSPSAKIYLCTIFSGGYGVDIPVSNSVIRQIAAKYSLPVIDMNVAPFTEPTAAGAMHPIDNHFQDVGYLTVAEYIKDSICDIISKNKSAYNLVGGQA